MDLIHRPFRVRVMMKLPKHLGWLALLAWMAPELMFAGMFLYALWVEWCFR